MQDKVNKTARLIYGSILGVMTAILGALFIVQVLHIYFTGTAADYDGKYIFTVERVGEHLSSIGLAVWLWIILVVVGFIVWELFPVKEKFAGNDVRYSLYRMKKRMPASVGEQLQSSFAVVKREERVLRILWLVAFLFCAAAGIYTVVYLAVPSHFPAVENKTGPILNMVKNVMPFVAAAFLLCCGVAVYEGRSAKRQLDEVKKLAKGNKPSEISRGKIYRIVHHKYFLLGVRVGVACLGVALIIAGIFNDSVHDLLVKAINICTECIGLG